MMRRQFAALVRAHLLLAVALAPRVAAAQPVARRVAAAQPGRIVRIPIAKISRMIGTDASDTALRFVRAGKASALTSTADSVSLRPGDFVFRKVAMAARVELRQPNAPRSSRVAYELPYRWITVDSTGSAYALRPRMEVEGGGLTYDAVSRVYTARAFVGLEDSLRANGTRSQLPVPLRMMLTLQARGGTVTPPALAIDHTSLDYLPIELRASDTANLVARIRTAVDTAGVTIALRAVLPPLILRVSPAAVEAFGLASAHVSVELPPGIAPTTRVRVDFGSSSVAVDPPSVMVVPNEINAASIRSGTPGEVTLVAQAAGFESASETLRFIWPWRFLSAALVGVALGALLGFGAGKRMKRWSTLPSIFIRGAPFGVVVALLSALGVDALGAHLNNPGAWIGVVATAALGTWGGPKVLGRFAGAAP
jgi:hypothetical protein